MKKDIIYSTLIHSSLLLLLFLGGGSGDGDKDGGSSQPQPELNVEIIDKPNDSDKVKRKEPEDGIVFENYKTHYTEDGKCDKYYGGVGVTIRSIDGLVYDVFKGYPADLVGIKPDDKIINHLELKGPPGTKISMLVLRNNESLTIEVVRDKICHK